MWANAQRDGRPDEHRWRLCSTPQSLADAHYNSAVKLAGMPKNYPTDLSR